MALPTLDATFASAADLPRKMMLAKWLVEELGSGSIADYYDLPERYLWAKIAVAAGAPKTEADYISLPKQYVWSDIYNAVAGLIPPSNVLVSGFGEYNGTNTNGIYLYDGIINEKPSYKIYVLDSQDPPILRDFYIQWFIGGGGAWILNSDSLGFALSISYSDTPYPWDATWELYDGGNEVPTLAESLAPSPNHTDWSEKQALGHIAAAYRGDTANPANLATYIDWPWRYQVASIIGHIMGNYNAIIVSGAGFSELNGTYTKRGNYNNRPYYNLIGSPNNPNSNSIKFYDVVWVIDSFNDGNYYTSSESLFPWNATWISEWGDYNPPPTLTPTNV